MAVLARKTPRAAQGGDAEPLPGGVFGIGMSPAARSLGAWVGNAQKDYVE
jgi:hypothetical protein